MCLGPRSEIRNRWGDNNRPRQCRILSKMQVLRLLSACNCYHVVRKPGQAAPLHGYWGYLSQKKSVAGREDMHTPHLTRAEYGAIQ